MAKKYLNKQSIFKDYKFGKLNLNEAIKSLSKHKVSKKNSLSKLMQINRKNIIKFMDYLSVKKMQSSFTNYCEDEECFFEIEYSSETENYNEIIFEINYDENND